MLLTCADVHEGCDVVLHGGGPADIVQEYVAHASHCMHKVQPVELEVLLGSILSSDGVASLSPRP